MRTQGDGDTRRADKLNNFCSNRHFKSVCYLK